MDRKDREVVKCCVPSCKATSYNSNEVSFYSFPKEKKLKEEWITALRHKDMYSEIIRDHGPRVISRMFVCSRHFTANDFKTPSEEDNSLKNLKVENALVKRSLADGVVPSVFSDPAPVSHKRGRKKRSLIMKIGIHKKRKPRVEVKQEPQLLTSAQMMQGAVDIANQMTTAVKSLNKYADSSSKSTLNEELNVERKGFGLKKDEQSNQSKISRKESIKKVEIKCDPDGNTSHILNSSSSVKTTVTKRTKSVTPGLRCSPRNKTPSQPFSYPVTIVSTPLSISRSSTKHTQARMNLKSVSSPKPLASRRSSLRGKPVQSAPESAEDESKNVEVMIVPNFLNTSHSQSDYNKNQTKIKGRSRIRKQVRTPSVNSVISAALARLGKMPPIPNRPINRRRLTIQKVPMLSAKRRGRPKKRDDKLPVTNSSLLSVKKETPEVTEQYDDPLVDEEDSNLVSLSDVNSPINTQQTPVNPRSKCSISRHVPIKSSSVPHSLLMHKVSRTIPLKSKPVALPFRKKMLKFPVVPKPDYSASLLTGCPPERKEANFIQSMFSSAITKVFSNPDPSPGRGRKRKSQNLRIPHSLNENLSEGDPEGEYPMLVETTHTNFEFEEYNGSDLVMLPEHPIINMNTENESDGEELEDSYDPLDNENDNNYQHVKLDTVEVTENDDDEYATPLLNGFGLVTDDHHEPIPSSLVEVKTELEHDVKMEPEEEFAILPTVDIETEEENLTENDLPDGAFIQNDENTEETVRIQLITSESERMEQEL